MPLLKLNAKGEVCEVSTAHERGTGVGEGPRDVLDYQTRVDKADAGHKKRLEMSYKAQMKRAKARKKAKKDQLYASRAKARRDALIRKKYQDEAKAKAKYQAMKDNIFMEGFQRTVSDTNFDDLNPVTGHGRGTFVSTDGPVTDYEQIVNAKTEWGEIRGEKADNRRSNFVLETDGQEIYALPAHIKRNTKVPHNKGLHYPYGNPFIPNGRLKKKRR